VVLIAKLHAIPSLAWAQREGYRIVPVADGWEIHLDPPSAEELIGPGSPFGMFIGGPDDGAEEQA